MSLSDALTAHQGAVEKLILEAEAVVRWIEEHVHLIQPILNDEGKAVHDLAGIKAAIENARGLVPSSGPGTGVGAPSGTSVPSTEPGLDSTGGPLPSTTPADTPADTTTIPAPSPDEEAPLP